MSSSPDRVQRRAAVDGLPAPTGPYAWTVSFGDLVFVSGLRGIDEGSGEPAPTDEGRVRLIFDRLRIVLETHGCEPGDVLATRVYVTDMGALRPLVNDAYERFFGSELPTRTIVEVRALNQGDSVEVEAVIGRRGHVDGDGTCET
ncbi:MAG: RidA family protein, partial [Nocardioidaceae bacterium]